LSPHPLFDIAGRVALVTGSGQGIGKALAQGLAEAGCTVVLNGRNPDKLEATRTELIAATGANVAAQAFDVTDPQQVEQGIAAVETTVGPLDIVVNNTGAQHRTPLVDFADADWYRLLETNLTSAFLVGREAARRMTPRGRGKIINICSVQSETVRPGIAPYSANQRGPENAHQGHVRRLGAGRNSGERSGTGLFRDRTDLRARR
jgi:gluconate 5-dehydrogenase